MLCRLEQQYWECLSSLLSKKCGKIALLSRPYNVLIYGKCKRPRYCSTSARLLLYLSCSKSLHNSAAMKITDCLTCLLAHLSVWEGERQESAFCQQKISLK